MPNTPSRKPAAATPVAESRRGRPAGETREALLDATATAIAQHGWSAVTTRQVASIAGVNAGLVHYHFGSMEALRRQAVLAAMAEEIEGPMATLLADLPLLDAIAGCVDAVAAIDPATDRFALLYEAMLEAGRDAELRAAVADSYHTFRTLLAARIREAGGSDPDAAATVVIAALDGVLLHRMVAPDLDIRGITAPLLAALQVPGLAPGPVRSSAGRRGQSARSSTDPQPTEGASHVFEPIQGLPAGVIGFEAVGEIESADYEDVLVPAIKAASAAGGIRAVLVLGDRFTGYTASAMKDDAGLVAQGGWTRTALVSDLGWVNHLATLFGWMVPGKFKHFGLADRDAAIAWVAED